MFTSLLTLVSFTLLASAAPSPWGKPQPKPASEACNVGSLQCCSDIQKAGAPGIQGLLSSLGGEAQGADVPIGLTCNPISGFIGAGTAGNCNTNPVCCDKTLGNGVAAIGCNAFNLDV